MSTKRFIQICVLSGGLLLPAAAAHAQFASIARGLYLLGFTPDVTYNPLTKGYNATYSRSFFNDTLDYGISSLTLAGGMTLQGSVGKCPFPGLSFGIKSTANPKGAAGPLSYTLTIPRAAEQITVTGNITINTSTKVDQTGYYSRTVSISNRGTVTTNGITDSTNNIDFDIGPVSETGNIYLKAIGGLVDAVGGDGAPIAGLPNTGPLVSLSQYDLGSIDVDSLNLDDPEQLERVRQRRASARHHRRGVEPEHRPERADDHGTGAGYAGASGAVRDDGVPGAATHQKLSHVKP